MWDFDWSAYEHWSNSLENRHAPHEEECTCDKCHDYHVRYEDMDVTSQWCSACEYELEEKLKEEQEEEEL